MSKFLDTNKQLEEECTRLRLKCETLEKNNKDWSDQLLILKKNCDESNKRIGPLKEENARLALSLEEKTEKIQILESKLSSLIKEDKVKATMIQELNEKLNKYKEIFQFVTMKAKNVKRPEENMNQSMNYSVPYDIDKNLRDHASLTDLESYSPPMLPRAYSSIVSKNSQNNKPDFSRKSLAKRGSTDSIPEQNKLQEFEKDYQQFYSFDKNKKKSEKRIFEDVVPNFKKPPKNVDSSLNINKSEVISPEERKKISNSQYIVEEENHLKPKMSPGDLYASKKTTDDVSYFIPPVESEKTQNDSPRRYFNPYKTPLVESNVIVENETNPRISEMKPYNKINNKMENFFIRKTSFIEPSADSLNSDMKLFEEFLIVGVNKSDFEKKAQTEDSRIRLIEDSSLLYNYPTLDDETQKVRRNFAPTFCFPFGVEMKKIRVTNSFSHFHEIIFANNINELNGNSFIFILKPDEKFTNSKKNKVKNEFLKACNPELLLYCICYVAKDFVGVKKEKQRKLEFWATKKVYCFMTYFPFFNFFLDIIVCFLNNMKLKRMELNKTVIKQEDLYEIDSEFFYKSVRDEVEQCLDQLRRMDLPFFSQKHVIKVPSDESCYLVTNSREVTPRQEALWGSFFALSSIPLENFVFLLLAILLENSVAFFSANSSLLSATLLTFHNFLKPFSWPHPLIFNLPKSFLQIFDSPVPFIAGVHKPYEYAVANKFALSNPHTIFVDLDNSGQHYYEKLVNDVPVNTKNALCNDLRRYWDLIADFKKTSAHMMKNREEEICYPIFSTIEVFLISKILNALPERPVFNDTQKKVIDITALRQSMLSKASTEDAAFIENLTKTQLFILYAEEYYDVNF